MKEQWFRSRPSTNGERIYERAYFAYDAEAGEARLKIDADKHVVSDRGRYHCFSLGTEEPWACAQLHQALEWLQGDY